MKSDLLDSVRKVSKYWWTSLLVGILAIIVGIWCLATPDVTLVALTFVFIVALFTGGIIDIIFAVSNKDVYDGWGWTLAGGIIDVLLGILLLTFPLPVITVILVYFIGFWILFRSIWTIGSSFELQRMGVTGWGWLLALSILGILFSFFYLLSPVINGVFVVALVSVAFVSYGIFRIYFSIKLKGVNDRIKNYTK